MCDNILTDVASTVPVCIMHHTGSTTATTPVLLMDRHPTTSVEATCIAAWFLLLHLLHSTTIVALSAAAQHALPATAAVAPAFGSESDSFITQQQRKEELWEHLEVEPWKRLQYFSLSRNGPIAFISQ